MNRRLFYPSVRNIISILAVLLFAQPCLAALSVGQDAPQFSLQNQNGKNVSLTDYKGKPVLIYFYPKDETPGCTKEACSLRDQYKKFQKLGAIILGISVQDEKTHQAFIKHHSLPFDLLVDADGKVAKSYGVGTILGTSLLERKSVLVGPDQKILRLYDSVDPSNHADQVLKDITESKSGTKS